MAYNFIRNDMKIIFSILLLFFLTSFIKSQELRWNHLGGPMGGCVGDFDIDSKGNIYAGVYTNLFTSQTYEGIYKSTDNGESWNKLDTGIDQFEVYAVYINSADHIFVGTNYGDRLYRSTDEGATWQIINSGYNTAECWAIGENKNSTIIFAGDGQFGKLYRSSNYGNNWQLVANLPVLSFAVDSSNNIYCGTFIGLYKSTDDGLSWNPAGFNNIPVNKIVIGENNRIICGTGYYDNGQGVYYSDDYGLTWTNFGLNGKVVLSLDFTSYGSLFAGTLIYGLFETTDWGNSWVQHTNGLFNKQVFRLKVNSSDDIFIGSENEGIFRSTNRAENFKQVGLPISSIYNLDFMSDSVIVCGTVSGVQTYNRLTEEWENIGLQAVLAVETTTDGDILAATNGGGLFQSTDFGQNWINICQSPYILNVKKINNTILAATDTGLIRSTNNGLTWNATPVKTGFERAAIEVNNNGDIWSVGLQKLYRSNDEGISFDSTENFGFIRVELNRLLVKDSLIVFRSNTTESPLYYTLDYGGIWQNKKISVVSINGNDEYIIAGTYKHIIYTSNKFLSIDSIAYPEQFYGIVKEIEFDENGKLFFGTSSQGLYAMDFIVNVDDDIPTVVNNFIMYPLYPNPFNSTINCSYTLPHSSDVTICINNILGEKINEIKVYRSSGLNKERISFDGMVSGIYLISIESKDFFAIKKAVFLK